MDVRDVVFEDFGFNCWNLQWFASHLNRFRIALAPLDDTKCDLFARRVCQQ